MALRDHYTKPDPAQVERENATHYGMAHWGGTGPADRTCRECLFWAPVSKSPRYKREYGGDLRDRRCRKYTHLTHGVLGVAVPHYAASCNFFQPADNPPPVDKPKRKTIS
jgi:hypothetical protein